MGGGHFTPVTLQKSYKISAMQKLPTGTSQAPKGIQKVSKRHPKRIQKVSKRHPNLYKLDPTGIQILKSQCKKLQRTLHPIRLPNCNKFIKPLACPQSMQVYRYSSQKSIEQPKCKELQRTLPPIRAHQTQSNLEVQRCSIIAS